MIRQVALIALLAAGCAPTDEPEQVKYQGTISYVKNNFPERFVMEQKMWFPDGNGIHHFVWLITDNETGAEWLGFEGMGIIDLPKKPASMSDAVLGI